MNLVRSVVSYRWYTSVVEESIRINVVCEQKCTLPRADWRLSSGSNMILACSLVPDYSLDLVEEDPAAKVADYLLEENEESELSTNSCFRKDGSTR